MIDIDSWRGTTTPSKKLHIVTPEDRVTIGVDKVSNPPVNLHIVGTVRSVKAERHVYGDVLDDEGNSMLVLSLLDLFENQHVEITVRVLE